MTFVDFHTKWTIILGHRVHQNLLRQKKKRLTDQEISNLFENPLSSDENFDIRSGTDLGEGDSADDNVDFEFYGNNNDVNEVVLDNRDESNINNQNRADVKQVSLLNLDRLVEENIETGTITPPF